MGFRRSESEEPGSSRWRSKHHRDLLACGLPGDLLESDRRLTYVLLHGHDPQSGWRPSRLSDEEAERLLVLLTKIITDPTGFDLIGDLQRQLGDRE